MDILNWLKEKMEGLKRVYNKEIKLEDLKKCSQTNSAIWQ